MSDTRKDVAERIESLELAIRKANEYLQYGKHADWRGFQPLFVQKYQDGKLLPPHKDWVQNVFLPRIEKELDHAERVLERLD